MFVSSIGARLCLPCSAELYIALLTLKEGTQTLNFVNIKFTYPYVCFNKLKN